MNIFSWNQGFIWGNFFGSLVSSESFFFGGGIGLV